MEQVLFSQVGLEGRRQQASPREMVPCRCQCRTLSQLEIRQHRKSLLPSFGAEGLQEYKVSPYESP